MNSHKYCIVPACKNTARNNPSKIFFQVPVDKVKRNLWLEAMGTINYSVKSNVYVCEDHFNLQDDMLNYMQMKMMGTSAKKRIKPGVVPHLALNGENNKKVPPVKCITKPLNITKSVTSEHDSNLSPPKKKWRSILPKTNNSIAEAQGSSNTKEDNGVQEENVQSFEEIFIKEEPLEKNTEDCNLYDKLLQGTVKEYGEVKCSNDNKSFDINEKSTIVKINEHNTENVQSFEEIFIKEEPLEIKTEDCDMFDGILQGTDKEEYNEIKCINDNKSLNTKEQNEHNTENISDKTESTLNNKNNQIDIDRPSMSEPMEVQDAVASTLASGSLEATTTSSSRSGQMLNTVHIDIQRQFTDQQRQTLATEPAKTTVQPSTFSDQIEVQAQSTFLDNDFGYACSVCDRLWFRKDLKPITAAQLKVISDRFIKENRQLSSEEYLVCNTCNKSLNKQSMPTLAIVNGFSYPDPPTGLPPLVPISERLISPRLPILQVRRLRHDFSYGIIGQVINVPVDVQEMSIAEAQGSSNTKGDNGVQEENVQSFEEIFIKEEPLEKNTKDCDMFDGVLQGTVKEEYGEVKCSNDNKSLNTKEQNEHNTENISDKTESTLNNKNNQIDIDRPSMSEPIEVQDAVASTLATPFAQTIIAASKSKAQKQHEYRQRITASRTPAQAAAARKAKNERQRNNRLRQAANLAIASNSLETTTTSPSRSGEESNNVLTRSQRQYAQQLFTDQQRQNLATEPAETSVQPSTFSDQIEVQAQSTFLGNDFGYACSVCDRLWFRKNLTPITAAQLKVISDRFIKENRQLSSEEYLVCNTCKKSLKKKKMPTAAPKTRAQIQREYRQRIAASKTPAQLAAARKARNVRERNNRLRKAANLVIASGSLEATTTSSSRSGQRLNTVHIDTQRQFTDQQRQTLATEPAETTVQPSTFSDQIEVQAQSTFLDNDFGYACSSIAEAQGSFNTKGDNGVQEENVQSFEGIFIKEEPLEKNTENCDMFDGVLQGTDKEEYNEIKCINDNKSLNAKEQNEHNTENISDKTESTLNNKNNQIDIDRPSMREPMEVQDAVASTLATPFAQTIIAASKSKAQKQREYRQRISASRTPAQLAAAREARNVRERNNRLRKAANLIIASGSLEATTTSSFRSGQRLNTVHIDTQRQFTDQQRQTLQYNEIKCINDNKSLNAKEQNEHNTENISDKTESTLNNKNNQIDIDSARKVQNGIHFYQCPVCNKIFMEKEYLVSHWNVHSDVKKCYSIKNIKTHDEKIESESNVPIEEIYIKQEVNEENSTDSEVGYSLPQSVVKIENN